MSNLEFLIALARDKYETIQERIETCAYHDDEEYEFLNDLLADLQSDIDRWEGKLYESEPKGVQQ